MASMSASEQENGGRRFQVTPHIRGAVIHENP
jgi:hypothetical protein